MTPLEARAQRLGIAEQGVGPPRIWAPAAERRGLYTDLFRQGSTISEVWEAFPKEDYNLIWRCHNKVHLERVREADKRVDREKREALVEADDEPFTRRRLTKAEKEHARRTRAKKLWETRVRRDKERAEARKARAALKELL